MPVFLHGLGPVVAQEMEAGGKWQSLIQRASLWDAKERLSYFCLPVLKSEGGLPSGLGGVW